MKAASVHHSPYSLKHKNLLPALKWSPPRHDFAAELHKTFTKKIARNESMGQPHRKGSQPSKRIHTEDNPEVLDKGSNRSKKASSRMYTMENSRFDGKELP